MIPLALSVTSDAAAPFVTRLSAGHPGQAAESGQLSSDGERSLWCGSQGLFEIDRGAADLIGDVVLVDPERGRLDRLIRASSPHNTLLVTEQCDQLCIMCSQPPKKTHVDRFDLLEQACLLAPAGQTIGISGGEPMLHAPQLLRMIEKVLTARDDLGFHVLTNGQHFEREHVTRLSNPVYSRVVWGIPLYAADPVVHDAVVAKPGAFDRLMASFAHLLLAGARIELRTVLTRATLPGLAALARFVVRELSHIEQWSLMGLENIGFARNRWSELFVDLPSAFTPIGQALDRATLHGVPARLFNLPLCQVPAEFRPFAVASISDWKQRFGAACSDCSGRPQCSGFFEWHPSDLVENVIPL
jgi:His-Xaa-Ser system radical SAM maturase HxsC